VVGVFDHVTIRVSDRVASEKFYDTVLEPLGIDLSYSTNAFAEWGDFSLTMADAGHPVTHGLHVGFVAPSRDQVDVFWRTGTEAGYEDAGAPGPRPRYQEDYYGAFLRDPDGNSIEAVHRAGMRRGGNVDHVWIRVADVRRAATFYKTIAPFADLHVSEDEPELARFGGKTGSFTLVADGPATENLHMAFPTDDDTAIRRFHEAATAGGYRDHGVPGERPQYHPGYYAAYVLDPDGNNIELVNHHRS
jgi:catechol 2,3-dioxygenase-like lactoylglutathione lyase family enzyme